MRSQNNLNICLSFQIGYWLNTSFPNRLGNTFPKYPWKTRWRKQERWWNVSFLCKIRAICSAFLFKKNEITSTTAGVFQNPDTAILPQSYRKISSGLCRLHTPLNPFHDNGNIERAEQNKSFFPFPSLSLYYISVSHCHCKPSITGQKQAPVYSKGKHSGLEPASKAEQGFLSSRQINCHELTWPRLTSTDCFHFLFFPFCFFLSLPCFSEVQLQEYNSVNCSVSRILHNLSKVFCFCFFVWVALN